MDMLLQMLQAEPMPVTISSEALAPIVTLHGMEQLRTDSGHATNCLPQL